MVYQSGPREPWREALLIARAVKSSSFAMVRFPDYNSKKKTVSRICYQDLELYLRERVNESLVSRSLSYVYTPIAF